MIEPEPPLTRGERIGSALAGGVLTACGIVATFLGKGDIAPTSLIGIGTVFVLYSVNGRRVTRAKLGEYEVEFAREFRKNVAAALAERDPSTEGLAEAVLDIADPRHDPLAAMATAVVYERSVAETLGSLGVEVTRPGGRHDTGIDAVVRTAEDVLIGVQVKASSRPIGAEYVNHLFSAFLNSQFASGILVAKSGFTSSAQRAAPGLRVVLVKWDVDEGAEPLRNALSTAESYAHGRPKA